MTEREKRVIAGLLERARQNLASHEGCQGALNIEAAILRIEDALEEVGEIEVEPDAPTWARATAGGVQ